MHSLCSSICLSYSFSFSLYSWSPVPAVPVSSVMRRLGRKNLITQTPAECTTGERVPVDTSSSHSLETWVGEVSMVYRSPQKNIQRNRKRTVVNNCVSERAKSRTKNQWDQTLQPFYFLLRTNIIIIIIIIIRFVKRHNVKWLPMSRKWIIYNTDGQA